MFERKKDSLALSYHIDENLSHKCCVLRGNQFALHLLEFHSLPRPPTPRAIMRTNLLWNFIQKMFQKQTVPKITLLVVNWLIGKENPVLRYAIQVCFRLFYLERPRDVVSYPSFVSLQLVNLYQYRVAMSLNYSCTELNCFNI